MRAEVVSAPQGSRRLVKPIFNENYSRLARETSSASGCAWVTGARNSGRVFDSRLALPARSLINYLFGGDGFSCASRSGATDNG